MNAFTKSAFAYLSILSLFTLDLAARGGGGNRGGGGGGRPNVSRANVSRPAPSRPAPRPASSANRSPITGTNLKRPAATPSRPASVSRPTPSARPATPAARPNPQPNRPNPQPDRPNPGAGGGNAIARPEPRPAPRPEGRPATLPGNVSYPKPGTKPAPRPTPGIGNQGPGAGNTRPAPLPGNRPGGDNRPNPNPPGKGDRPVTLPANRPGGNGPGVNRPGNGNRPVTLPAQRPGRPGNPGLGNHRPETLPAQRPSRPGINTRPPQRPNFDRPTTLPARVPGDRPGSGNRPGTGNRPGGNNNWWNSGNINSGNVTINNNNVRINNNFRNNLNWSTNQRHWGYNPWWNRPATHPWYGGCWNHGWHGGYYGGYYRGWYGYRPPGYFWDDDNDVAEAIGWGLVGWGLGALCFSSGYNDYHNPYPAPPVTTRYSTQVTYTQPITVVASEVARTEPAKVETMVQTSASQIELSQEAFRQGNYLAALESANAAIAESPGDGALHEYRALVLFALGKYSEAAGVLNPVLAGGPGWDWTTMAKLYDSQETYSRQLAALEAYAGSKTDAADVRFLLGYHYMVCGHVEQAAEQFGLASRLQPQDSVSKQLYNLCSVTADDQEEEEKPLPEAAAAPDVAPEIAPLEKLGGKWVVDKGDKGVVTLTMDEAGKFTWEFSKDGKTDGFSGDYSMNDDGLLVLDSEEAQMVATVALPKDDTLSFVIAGGPPGDTGLQFSRKS
jgi:tetratricopeptide (TPR) repeat protein